MNRVSLDARKRPAGRSESSVPSRILTFHGELAVDQLFHMRPAPGYADYRTPVPGLYQASSATQDERRNRHPRITGGASAASRPQTKGQARAMGIRLATQDPDGEASYLPESGLGDTDPSGASSESATMIQESARLTDSIRAVGGMRHGSPTRARAAPDPDRGAGSGGSRTSPRS
jgi:hypothetical protein